MHKITYNILDVAIICALFSVVLLGGGTLHKVVLLPTAIIILFIEIVIYKEIKIKLCFLPLWIGLLAAIISTLLTSKDIIFSMYKLAEFLTLVLMTAAYGNFQREHPQEIFQDKYYNLVLSFLKGIIVYCFCIAILFPNANIMTGKESYSMSKALLPYILNITTGIALNANSLGVISAIVLFDLLFRSSFKICNKFSAKEIFLYIATLFCLVFSQSRTSWIAIVFSLAMILSFGGQNTRRLRWILLVILIPLIAVNLNTIIEYFLRGRSAQELFNMSGRMSYWPIIAEKVIHTDDKSFFWGLGYGTAVKQQYGDYQLASLHSDFMDALANMGIIGIIIVTLYWLWILFSRGRHLLISMLSKNSQYKASQLYKMGISIIILIRAITGSTIFSLSVFSILLILLMCNSNKIGDSL